jgi:hypothetical protein
VKTSRCLSRSVFAVGFLALMLASAALGQQSVIHGRVVGVTDGDTIKVLVAEKQLLRIRLAFCDAPEKKQAFGARAKQPMSELEFSKEIELRPNASNWIEANQKQIDPNTPILQLASPGPLASPVNTDDVWINIKGGKHWKSGSRYYGKNKQGEYQSEEDAFRNGYVPANGTGE